MKNYNILPPLRGYNWTQAFGFANGGRAYDEHGGPVELDLASKPTTPVDVSTGLEQPGKRFDRCDVTHIISLIDGEHDAHPWRGLFCLRNGLFAHLVAGCDYTGWG